MNILRHAVLGVAVAALSGGAARAAFIANLDGSSTDSTFEVGSATALPTLNWTNVTDTARVFDDDGLNGALINNASRYNNYEVQYTSSTPIEALKTYTLSLDMGFYGGGASSHASAGYQFQLGTVNAGVFTPLGSAKTGTALFGNNMSTTAGPWVPRHDSLSYSTSGTVSGDVLAVRWAQTSTDQGVSWFGFDNVQLEVAPVPEPASLLLVPAAAFLLARRPSRSIGKI